MINWNSLLLVACGAMLGLAFGLTLTPFVTSDVQPHVALWLEIVNQVSSSIGSLGTLVALIFVAAQFKLASKQSELLRRNITASMDNVLYARLDSFNRFIVEHHTVYELLNTLGHGQEPVDQRAKLHHLCDLAFTFYEEVHKHHARYQFLHAEDRDEWDAQMTHFFGKLYVQGYWHQVSNRYSRGFQKAVDEMYQLRSLKIAG